MSMSKAIWAAKLICDNDRKHDVEIISADEVIVRELNRSTTIAQTTTTEPALLQALLKEIEQCPYCNLCKS